MTIWLISCVMASMYFGAYLVRLWRFSRERRLRVYVEAGLMLSWLILAFSMVIVSGGCFR